MDAADVQMPNDLRRIRRRVVDNRQRRDRRILLRLRRQQRRRPLVHRLRLCRRRGRRRRAHLECELRRRRVDAGTRAAHVQLELELRRAASRRRRSWCGRAAELGRDVLHHLGECVLLKRQLLRTAQRSSLCDSTRAATAIRFVKADLERIRVLPDERRLLVEVLGVGEDLLDIVAEALDVEVEPPVDLVLSL